MRKKTARCYQHRTVNVIAQLRRKRADYYRYYSTSALLLHTQITVKELIFLCQNVTEMALEALFMNQSERNTEPISRML